MISRIIPWHKILLFQEKTEKTTTKTQNNLLADFDTVNPWKAN